MRGDRAAIGAGSCRPAAHPRFPPCPGQAFLAVYKTLRDELLEDKLLGNPPKHAADWLKEVSVRTNCRMVQCVRALGMGVEGPRHGTRTHDTPEPLPAGGRGPALTLMLHAHLQMGHHKWAATPLAITSWQGQGRPFMLWPAAAGPHNARLCTSCAPAHQHTRSCHALSELLLTS